jgi:transposase-like protein
LIISDDHVGLEAARRAVFGAIPWQRFQFHLQQNAEHYVPRRFMRREVAEVIRMIFPGQDLRQCARPSHGRGLFGTDRGEVRRYDA